MPHQETVMTPVEILMNEHRNIERMLDCLEAMTVTFLAERHIDADLAREAVAFLQGYADRCHHGKEEARLFQALEEHGLAADCGPTAVMRYEHEQGRTRIKEMAEAIAAGEKNDDEAPARFARAARMYLGLLREHIQKEDHCLFPMVGQVLNAKNADSLQKDFERFEREEIDSERRAGLLKSLEHLEARFIATARK
jgi:hemerythrin-like domain-containing protein